jgi:heptosyltransferase-3
MANPDIRRVIAVPENAKDPSHLGTLVSLIRRYDLAVSTLPGDRPIFTARRAGRHCMGPLLPGPRQWWKRLLLSRSIAFDDRDTHTVLLGLRLADLLGIERACDVVVSWSPPDAERVARLFPSVRTGSFAVLHLYPKYRYKMWSREGWKEVASWLHRRGVGIVLTGSGDPDELAYVEAFRREMPDECFSLAGKLTLEELGYLVSLARAYVGPDTVVTHMAAALGVPTVALYGPTNAAKWSPWPKGYRGEGNPFPRQGGGRLNNVTLLQGPGDCVPCGSEGCDQQIESASDCLQKLPASLVIEALMGSGL